MKLRPQQKILKNNYKIPKRQNAVFLTVLFLLFFSIGISARKPAKTSIIQIMFCSDVHFGLTKPTFRGKQDVSSMDVNAAMVAQMNGLPSLFLPNDDGVGAGEKISGIDAIAITGDLCNRQEIGIQSASVSWEQFKIDYISRLRLSDKNGNKSKLLLTPGNHDISDAIGYEKPMQPLVDNASLVGIYNLMMHPTVAKNATTYNYQTDKIHYSRAIGGIHLVFVDAWPDSAERVWMEKDLKHISAKTPVLLFTHSMPNVEARFFTNPNGNHDINATDRFENLVQETFKDGTSVKDSAILEQKAFVAFLQAHPNIKAYFHGHNNNTEFYDWKGPDNNINLPCFRVDSPMKGKYSAKDETKLSFELISIDPIKKSLTVRECLWNAHPDKKLQNIEWGIARTVPLQ